MHVFRYSCIECIKRFSITYHAIVKCENAHIAAMVYMILTHYRTGKVFYPYSSQRISADFIVLVRSLSIISNIQTNIFTITNIAVTYNWIGSHSTHTNRSTDYYRKCNKKKPLIEIDQFGLKTEWLLCVHTYRQMCFV